MYGTRAGSSIMAVVKAFKAGKACRRGNASTDGKTYYLFGNAIARHIVDPDEITEQLMNKLRGDPYTDPRLQVSWAGWPSMTTERHLNALGVDARKDSCGAPCRINGRAVDDAKGRWYTVEELEHQPEWKPEPKARRVRFVNLTKPLFEEA
jgi:hypothetical protein